MKRDGNLFHRAKIHDWESIEPHDVMDGTRTDFKSCWAARGDNDH